MTSKIVRQDSKPVQEQSAMYQYFGAIVVNLLMVAYGVSCGWPSPSNQILMSDASPLPTGSITMNEASSVAAFSYPGGLVGNFVAGFITKNFGRKIPLLLLAIPTIIGWLLVLFAQNVYYLYASRLLNGFVGGSICVIIPLFTSEIANDSVRGILGSIFVFACNIGILAVYILGDYCDYFMIPKFVIALTVIYVILFIFCPESPLFLVKKNNIREAKRSIRFYQNIRGKDRDSKLIDTENELLNKLKATLLQSENSAGTSFSWSEIFTNPGRKAFIIGLFLSSLNTMSGVSALLCYTANVFAEAGSNLSPNSSAIVIGIILLIGAAITTNLVDRAGRRFLYAISTIGSALGYSTLGTYMLMKTLGYEVETYNWIPIASFSFALLAASWAILTLPFVVIAEIMPEHLKDFGASFCLSLVWIIAFFFTKFLPSLTDTIGFHGTMYLFGGVCLFSAVIVILFLPETKNKSYEQIMDILR